MTQADLNREIAQATGESVATIDRLGFVELTHGIAKLYVQHELVIACNRDRIDTLVDAGYDALDQRRDEFFVETLVGDTRDLPAVANGVRH